MKKLMLNLNTSIFITILIIGSSIIEHGSHICSGQTIGNLTSHPAQKKNISSKLKEGQPALTIDNGSTTAKNTAKDANALPNEGSAQLANGDTTMANHTSILPNASTGDTYSSNMPYPKKELSVDAMFRFMYVLMGTGFIVFFYLGVKYLRARRRSGASKYRVLARGDDKELFFPLSADEEEEEIFSASTGR